MSYNQYEFQWIVSLKRLNEIGLGWQSIHHIIGGKGIVSVSGEDLVRSTLSISSHPSLHSSSPLPPLHQAWQHPPTAGGDEAPPGWWQKSERGIKPIALKFRGWQTTNLSIRCSDNGKYLETTCRLKKSKWKTTACLNEWLCVLLTIRHRPWTEYKHSITFLFLGFFY